MEKLLNKSLRNSELLVVADVISGGIKHGGLTVFKHDVIHIHSLL